MTKKMYIKKFGKKKKFAMDFLEVCETHFKLCIDLWLQVNWMSVWANFGSILLSITNKMQRYTIFFITVNALHVSGGFSAHHQELKTVHTASGICQACLLLPLAVAEKPPETYRALTIIKNTA
jgi:hypothetical protein